MWNLTSSNLPNTALLNNRTVKGLELTELGTADLNTPLFKYSPIQSSSSTSRGENVEVGKEVVVETEIELIPESTTYFHRIEGVWDFETLDFVSSIYLLDEGKYTHYFGETLVISSESTLEGASVYFAYIPIPNETFQYEIDLTGVEIDTIDKVEVEGLLFLSSGGQTFLLDENTLILNSNPACRPKQNQVAEIYVQNSFSLDFSTQVYIFDVSAFNTDYVYYLDYLGKSYTQSTTLFPGSLINNPANKKVLVFN